MRRKTPEVRSIVLCDTIMFMTFRHTLYISVAAHILVFGSALAFAFYGNGLLWHTSEVIHVSLISPDLPGGSGSKAAPVPSRPVIALSERSVERVKDAPAEPPSKDGTTQKTVAIPETEPAHQSKYDAVMSGGTAGSEHAGTAPDASAGFGIVSPEEWAVIAAAIERTKNYPRIARERGIEGVVKLRFRLASSGTVEKIEIVQSSGYTVLDDASIRAVYRAAPMPYVNGWIEMPMRYVLK